MIPKLNRKKDSLSLMIESKIDPWDILRSKQKMSQNLKKKERLFHLEGQWNTIQYGTKGVIGKPKKDSPYPMAS
ncbi:unnamed protein product [marine sediment metagenome]|uniref:Uncharacterized protein n=1 Tax=marine sediment metagenome TaxID=412755 RepID=X1G3H9_9ZZZZ